LIVDRAKDIIISGGENIASVEVEYALAAHPVARFKAPRSVEFFESLPKGGSGTILKSELRERYWIGQARRVH
jgi:fatty-acyl-CoA synthase